jgi:hypothetical protein
MPLPIGTGVLWLCSRARTAAVKNQAQGSAMQRLRRWCWSQKQSVKARLAKQLVVVVLVGQTSSMAMMKTLAMVSHQESICKVPLHSH